MGFYSSPHVLQCLATLSLFIKIMKGKQKTVLAFSSYNDSPSQSRCFSLRIGLERLTNRPKTSRIVRKLYTEERNGFG